MLYSHEVIDLMARHPGKTFQMKDIVRHVGRGRPTDEKARIARRRAVDRLLKALGEHGLVLVTPAASRGKSALYRWHEK